MEIKIKSLLLDHIFIFVGYSLNNYNLKIVMKWRDIIIDKYNNSDKECESFTICPSKHEKYKNNSVYAIYSEGLMSKISNITLGELGKRHILNMINNFESVTSKISSNSNNFNKRYYLYEN